MEHHNVLVTVLYCSFCFLISILIFWFPTPSPRLPNLGLHISQSVFAFGKAGLQNLEKVCLPSPSLLAYYSVLTCLHRRQLAAKGRSARSWLILGFVCITEAVCYRFKMESFRKESPSPILGKKSVFGNLGSNINHCNWVLRYGTYVIFHLLFCTLLPKTIIVWRQEGGD